MFLHRLSSTRIATVALVGCLAHACEGWGFYDRAPRDIGEGVQVRRPEKFPEDDVPAVLRAASLTSLPRFFPLAAYLTRSTASCKAPDNTVDAAQVEKAVEEIGLLLDEHAHRLGRKTHGPPSPSVSIDSNGFRATFSVPRGAITAELVIEGIRTAVRSLQSKSGAVSLSLSKQDTFGDEGRASSIRVQTSAGVGDLRIDLLQPFDADEDYKLEVRGDLLPGSVELMLGAMSYVCSPGGIGSRGRVSEWRDPWGSMFDGNPSPMLGTMEDIMRLLMEETRRAGIPMGELDVDHGKGYDRQGEVDGLRRRERASSRNMETLKPLTDTETLVKTLEERGIRTYLPDKGAQGDDQVDVTHVDWRGLAGYEDQKRLIEENLLLPLRRPDVFDAVAAKTRAQYASNRPRAILFTGPPGTGKTSSARVIASQAGVPLCYIPLEAIASKWYGESEKKLSEALEMINEGFKDGAVIFLDELDSLATTRGSDMHEATRRMLGVLLRFLDGFDQNKRAVVVGATNTPDDLDPALCSRFSANIEFGLPDEQCRVKILKQYAQHLPEEDILALAKATEGFSGRDLRDVCGYAERHWATLIIKGVMHEGSTPGVPAYLDAVRARR